MTFNLDFWKRHIHPAKWWFVVTLTLLVLALYIPTLVISLIDNDSWSAAISGAVITFYTHSLAFQLIRPPGQNRYWVVVMSKKMSKTGGPYTKDTGYKVFDKVVDLLSKEAYTGVIDAFLIQSKDEDTAVEEARKIKENKNETKS